LDRGRILMKAGILWEDHLLTEERLVLRRWSSSRTLGEGLGVKEGLGKTTNESPESIPERVSCELKGLHWNALTRNLG